jgi:hypothetical protein
MFNSLVKTTAPWLLVMSLGVRYLDLGNLSQTP